ncbi:MAG: TetR family transcriptional regulator [Bacteroidetes bacterium]|nr:TetR family transcriptional regulator [Bacteroidota bacterium]
MFDKNLFLCKKNKKNILSAKQRILEAAAELIAANGYGGVGIRKIAEQAGINISMISYYFGGKIGILKSIMEDYNKEMFAIFLKVKEKNLSFEDGVKLFVNQMISLGQRKENICKVAMMEIPYEIPEIMEYKKSLMNENMKVMEEPMKRYLGVKNMKEHLIIGPLLMGMIFSNFLFVAPSKEYLGITLDDKFYKRYAEVITNFTLYGLTGYKNNINKK